MSAVSRRVAMIALAAAVVLGLIGATGDGQRATRVRPYPNRLPDGDGRAIAERSCLMCHSATLVTQQAKDSTAWARTVAQMVKWGTPLPAAEQDTLLRYLASHLGPRAARVKR
ncbi:MAG TPA: hypothetical protein VEY91_10785 [Candidatus Limnocylindria bacterium]|nr:hypothetical protein [Candidatus Limnocylindria bacterium]